jgi:hypothetical protein
MTFDFKDMPPRSEIRSILKTGKSVDGTEVHPESQKLLRVARLFDLETIGNEVNRANAALDNKINQVIANTETAISADRLNFFTFMSYLVETKVLTGQQVADYATFKSNSIKVLEESGQFMKDKEAEIHKKYEEVIREAQEKAKQAESGEQAAPKIILP